MSASSSAPRIPPDDRRCNRRAPIDVLANRFHEGYPYLCRATDISAEGMRLCRFNEPLGGIPFCGLQFQLPGSTDIISAAGQVVFEDVGSRAIGVRFTHLSKTAEAAIASYLHRTQQD
jgi:c-di-GMP-binding flagellar brake protein YcgR